MFYTKNQENHKISEKRQLTDLYTKRNQMLELSDKDFKTAILKMLQQSIMNSLEKIENLSKETEVIKKSQMEIIELKNTITIQ